MPFLIVAKGEGKPHVHIALTMHPLVEDGNRIPAGRRSAR